MFTKRSKKNRKGVKDKELNTNDESTLEQDDATLATEATGEDTDHVQSEEITTLKAENQELRDKYLRLYAEFDNYKKRTLKEKVDLMKNASADMIKVLLPVLDDFDRAKKTADDDSSEEHFSEGVTLVYNKLYAVLKNKGLTEMESNAEAFDPDLHEAITEIPAPTDDLKGKIVDTVEKGYLLNETIIRHAKVVVGK